MGTASSPTATSATVIAENITCTTLRLMVWINAV